MRRAVVVAASCAWALAACRTEQTLVEPDPHLERMLSQEKVLPYQANPLLPGGMAMQRPPDGTLPVSALVGEPLLGTGAEGGHWADRIPMPIDRATLAEGREQFDVFCATCHGVLGDGASAVSEKMTLRKPPSLVGAEVRAMPPGRIFRTIREGYGLMPSYAVQLAVRDAWGVVAYVRALQIARGVSVSRLPPPFRERLAREAP